MEIKTEHKTTIQFTGHIFDGELLSHPCPKDSWWGTSTCKEVSIDEKLKEIGLMKGEYKITITIEKIE